MAAAFDNQVAIVAGAGQGPGRGFALRFTKEGAALLLADIDLKKVDETARQVITAGGQAVAMVTDISSERDAQRLADEALTRNGQIGILLNNTGDQMGVGQAQWDAPWPKSWPPKALSAGKNRLPLGHDRISDCLGFGLNYRSSDPR